MEVALSTGGQDDQHSTTRVPRVDLQFGDGDLGLEWLASITQPAKNSTSQPIDGITNFDK